MGFIHPCNLSEKDRQEQIHTLSTCAGVWTSCSPCVRSTRSGWHIWEPVVVERWEAAGRGGASSAGLCACGRRWRSGDAHHRARGLWMVGWQAEGTCAGSGWPGCGRSSRSLTWVVRPPQRCCFRTGRRMLSVPPADALCYQRAGSEPKTVRWYEFKPW